MSSSKRPLLHCVHFTSLIALTLGVFACSSNPSDPLVMGGTEAGALAGQPAGGVVGGEPMGNTVASGGTLAGAGAEAGTGGGVELGGAEGGSAPSGGLYGGAEAGAEAGVEAGAEAGAETGVEAGAEAGAEAGVEAGAEAGAEAGQAGSPAPLASCDPGWLALTGEPLREALYQFTSSAYRPIEVELDLGGNPNRYTTARRHMFTNVERRSEGVYLLYLGTLYGLPEGMEPPHDVINCEHSWPRSKLVDDEGQPALYEHQQSDLHHLYPALSTANSARGSLPYGEVVSNRDLSYLPSELGLSASNRQVFEPRDEVKGDLARTYFYMSVRWKLQLSSHEEEVMRRWHVADPVDTWELERNARIASLQGNQNPFILCPVLVEQIDRFTGDGAQEDLPLP